MRLLIRRATFADPDPAYLMPPAYPTRQRHLAFDDVQSFGAGDWVPNQNASIKRIAELKRPLPDLVPVPGHDHIAYQFEHRMSASGIRGVTPVWIGWCGASPGVW